MTDSMNGDIGRQIGKLEGNVEALGDRVSAVSENLRQLRTENAADHGEVIRKLEGISARLDHKAEVPWVRAIESRTDSLEQTRDKGRGAVTALIVLNSLAVLAIAGLGVLAATGNL